MLKDIRMFMTGFGVIMGRDYDEANGILKLDNPVVISLADKDGVYAKPIFLDETWCKIPLVGAMELEVSNNMKELYKSQEQRLYGVIEVVQG